MEGGEFRAVADPRPVGHQIPVVRPAPRIGPISDGLRAVGGIGFGGWCLGNMSWPSPKHQLVPDSLDAVWGLGCGVWGIGSVLWDSVLV